MDVSKAYQGIEPLVVNAQSVPKQQVAEKKQTATSNQAVQQDFQVNLQDGLKTKLAEFATILQKREQLIQSLPESIKKAVVELLKQMSADTELSQGLESLLKGQKNASEQLKSLSRILDLSAVLQQDEQHEVKVFLQKALENFAAQAEKTPEQAAKELVQLAKQLPVNNAAGQGNFSPGLGASLEQMVLENRQQLNQTEQKNILKLANFLEQDMPEALQQLAKQNKLPELPGVWAMLKMAEAWQFKDIQPTTLQAAADLLKQLAQEMSSQTGSAASQLEEFVQSLPPEASKATVAAKLEQFVKTLPPEIGNALKQALKQDNIPDSLRRLADTFSNAIVLNQEMNHEMQSFVAQMMGSKDVKSSSLLADANHVLTQLSKQITVTGTIVEQIKTLLQQLETQLFAGDPKLLEKQEPILDQLTKLFEQNIPSPLQEGMVKHKLIDLPKIWVLLKALGAEQWQNVDTQDLKKSAGAVKELAQSIYKVAVLTGEKQAEHSAFSFSIPLQVAEGIYYPAHIHIYHQQEKNSEQLVQRQFETWLRVAVDTENIGVVDSVFRLYGDNNLDVRVNFTVLSAAEQFSQSLPNIKQSLEDTKLSVTDIMINKI